MFVIMVLITPLLLCIGVFFYLDLNEEIQSMWITNDVAEIFWGKPGFFVNNTDGVDGIFCNWTRGEGK